MKKKDIHIIGGGIIGLSSAWYLMEKGYSVTLIDRSDLSDSTSHGNAGMVVPSHFVPLASPGVIGKGIKWMFSKSSPFYIKPRLSMDLVKWLYHFYKSCNQAHVDRSMSVLYEFNEWSKALYREFSKSDEFNFCFEEQGLLMLYKSAKQEKEELDLQEKALKLGMSCDQLDSDQVSKLNNNITVDVKGGVVFNNDAHLYPDRFVTQLKKVMISKGLKFVGNTEVADFVIKGDEITQLVLKDGEKLQVDQFLIAGGAFSNALSKKLEEEILLQPGKGYSITIKNHDSGIAIPTILAEAKVAITPMGPDLRIGGTLELGSYTATVDSHRLQGIMDSLPAYYPDFKVTKSMTEKVWTGYRPCTPDGMPYIDQFTKVKNGYIATGHGMMGMSMGPATGKLVAQMIAKETPHIDMSLFRLGRF